ncbi:MAG: PGF-pre-PGF domain-containing protein [Candidatus Aenigmatarchaeota archaeon]
MDMFLKLKAFALLALVLIAAPALAAPGVTRDLPSTVTAGASINVKLAVVLNGARYYAVDEIVPSGWTVTGASSGGNWTAHAGHIKWVCVEGCEDASLSYDIDVPADASGMYDFSGTWAVEGVNETPIGGDLRLNVTAPLVPDFTVSVSPASRTIDQGKWSTATVTVTSIAGYTNYTALGKVLPGALAGKVNVSFAPVSVVPPPNGTNISVANISVASNAPTGSYAINFTATGGGLVRMAAFSLTISAPAVCGNNNAEAGEDCDGDDLKGRDCQDLGYAGGALSCTDECEFDTSGCTLGGGKGGGSGSSSWATTIVRADIVQDCANFTISNLPAGYFVQWLNPNATLFKITRIYFVPKTNLQSTLVQSCKISLPASVAALPNAYQYFVFNATSGTSALADASVSELEIEFAVENSWISGNDIAKSSIALYRWTGTSWSKLNTTKFAEDAKYTRYEATSPGFSYFGIAGEKAACPVCPEPGPWSVCIAGPDGKGRQNRTEYECGAATNFTCKPKTVTQNCCAEPSPEPGAWGACSNAQQSRTAYQCSDATGYVWEQFTETRSCIDAPTASAAIASARAAVESAKSAGKNVTSAEALLAQANDAFSTGNYEGARNLALQAQNAAAAAPQLPAPPLLEIAAVILAIVGVACGAVYLKHIGRLAVPTALARLLRRQAAAPAMNICVVCGQPTTLRIRCSSCGQFACVRHMQTIAGKPYCSRCARRMYEA